MLLRRAIIINFIKIRVQSIGRVERGSMKEKASALKGKS
jgi:hypothetical protein